MYRKLDPARIGLQVLNPGARDMGAKIGPIVELSIVGDQFVGQRCQRRSKIGPNGGVKLDHLI